MIKKENIIELFDDAEIDMLKEILGNEFEEAKKLPIELKRALESGVGVEIYGDNN